MNKWFSFLLIIVSGSLYQILAEKVTPGVNPFASLIITYAAALITAMLFFYFTKEESSLISEWKRINLYSWLLGFVVCFLELGFVLAYRYGFSVALLSPSVSVVTMIVLAAVGIVFYKEKLNVMNIIGLVLAGIGVLMTIKK